jgi:uncharacterized MnhB-related membrane protein
LWYISQGQLERLEGGDDQGALIARVLRKVTGVYRTMESIQYLSPDAFWDAVFLLGAVFCAYRAIVAKRILSATIYLACVSALVSVVIYLLGAAQVAVMELSVGAGLVTVLLVYALSVVGDDALDPASVIPKPLAFAVVGSVIVLLGLMVYPATQRTLENGATSLASVLWQNRILDVWIQIALIFSGVMGVLGLLSEQTSSKNKELLQ